MEFNPVATYIQEAEELLGEIEHSALGLGVSNVSEETIHHLFRAFHTLKGSGAMCGLDQVAGFTHHVESLLEQVRNGEVPVSAALSDLVLKAGDHIKVLIGMEQGGPAPAAGSSALLISAIESLATPGSRPAAGESNPARQQSGARPEELVSAWSIQFRPNPALLSRGGNPAALFKDLRKLGPCEITAHIEDVPSLDSIEPDLCYLWWSILLRAGCSEESIRDVFIFVEDESKLEIERVEVAGDRLAVAGAATAGASTVGTVTAGAVTAGAVTVGTVTAGAVTVGTVTAGAVTVGGPETAEARTKEAPPAKSATLLTLVSKESTVRVPSSRLDRLVNLVGELVMNQSRLAQAAAQSGAAEFANPVQELERLVAEMRDNVLGIRMLPIGTLFSRFGRLVHDLSAELGKEVDLVTEGAETELDKSILDQLGEPLVHCLRNCLDHGIELPDDRVAKGKSRRATIRLAANHTGSDVVVSIQDDGRGIDRAAVRAKAVERQLITSDAALTDKEIFHLLLMPGFSTARQVTNVSGRGVGMDAVKRQIDALRGSLSLSSQAGSGTRISMTLPLTLAIIEGLLVQIGGDQFILPMSVVTENVELLSGDKARKNGRNLIAVRGDLVPYIDLRQTFRMDGAAPAVEKVVIVQHEDQRVGLVVDRVLGTHQTVIQSLGRLYRNINVVSGATIMGDGRVALILDIAAVLRHAHRECAEATAAA